MTATRHKQFPKRRIKSIDLIKVFLRSFLVQGSWNFKSMLGLGFCYCAFPIMKRLCASEQECENFLRRHLQFFNAHPYFTGWGLGAVAKLEEEAIRKSWNDQRPITLFKERISGPLGAIGDRLFWEGIKPATAGLAVVTALTIGWIAIPLLLLIYNIPHIFMRLHGLKQGYQAGFDIVSILSMRKFQKVIDGVFFGGAFIAGLNFMTAARYTWKTDPILLAVFFISSGIAAILLYLKKSMHTIILTVAVIAFGLGILFHIFFDKTIY